MQPNEQHVSVRISNRWLEYELMDRKHLQTRYYNKVMRGGSTFLLHRLKKEQMINILLETEFGKDEVREYLSEVQDWDACKWFCTSK